jgi:hypothetical protein
LQELWLWGNQITDATPLEALLVNQKKAGKPVLDISSSLVGNPLQTPPMEVVDKGSEAFLEWVDKSNPEKEQSNSKIGIKLFFAKAPTATECKGTYSVNSSIPKTLGIAKASIQKLFSDDRSYFYGFEKYLKSVNRDQDTLLIELDPSAKKDPKWGTLSTSCGINYYREIVDTAGQFDGIQKVFFVIDGQKELFQSVEYDGLFEAKK